MAQKRESTDSKWEGKAIVELRSSTADQVWPLLEDFCSLQKWYPEVDSCRQVKGVYGKPGLVLYVTLTRVSSPPDNSDQPPETVVKWCYETMLSVDPVQRCLSYQTTENNLGLGYYVGEWKVIDIKDGCGGCRIERRFTADPVEGYTLEGFCRHIQVSLNKIGEEIEKALQAANLK